MKGGRGARALDVLPKDEYVEGDIYLRGGLNVRCVRKRGDTFCEMHESS